MLKKSPKIDEVMERYHDGSLTPYLHTSVNSMTYRITTES